MVTSAAARAPGKAILFGEHAVVYGEGAIALSLSLHFTTRVTVAREGPTKVDGRPIDRQRHAYFTEAIAQVWRGRGPLKLDTTSSIPSSSGLGSSAALTVSTVGALKQLQGKIVQEEVARAAFEVELAVQGAASPTDTSVSSHGRAIYIAPTPGENHLWTLEKGGSRWCVHDLEVPAMDLVVGYTGSKGNTGALVAKVRERAQGSAEARAQIREIGAVVKDARRALSDGDLKRVGELMRRNHRLLVALGVSSDKLERLVSAAEPFALGAKLTGAGGGGCMIALTERPQECAGAIEQAGGKAYRAVVDPSGVTAI